MQHDRWERGDIARVWVSLRLKTERRLIGIVIFSRYAAIEEIAGIKLQTRTVGIHRKFDAGGWRIGGCGEGGQVAVFVQNIVEVISAERVAENRVFFVDVPSDGFGQGEIERRSRYVGDLVFDDKFLIRFGKLVRIDIDDGGQDRTVVTVQIEISVVGEVAQGILVGGRVVLEHKTIVVGQTVRDGKIHRSGEVFLAGGRKVRQFEGIVVYVGREHTVFKPVIAAVQEIVTFVGMKKIGFAVEGKPGSLDTVGDSTYNGVEIRIGRAVFVHGVEPCQNIDKIPLFCGNEQTVQSCAVRHDLQTQTVFIGKLKGFDPGGRNA